MSIGDWHFFCRARIFLWKDQCKVFKRYHIRSLPFAAIDWALGICYLFSNPFRICRLHLQKKNEENVHAYGETPLTAWEKIADLAGIQKNDVFLDLGCGRGRVCFWTHLWIGCPCIGVDWVLSFIRRARFLARLFHLKSLQFFCAGMDRFPIDQVSVIYLYTFRPEEDLIDFSQLKPGARVITISEPLRQSGFRLDRSATLTFPWGLADVYIQEKITIIP